MLLMLLEVVVGVDGDEDAGTEAPSLKMSAVPNNDPDDILRDTAESTAFCGFENEISNYSTGIPRYMRKIESQKLVRI